MASKRPSRARATTKKAPAKKTTAKKATAKTTTRKATTKRATKPTPDAERPTSSARRRTSKGHFDPRHLDGRLIAMPLAERMDAEPQDRHRVIIDVNLNHPKHQKGAKYEVLEWFRSAVGKDAGKLLHVEIDPETDVHDLDVDAAGPPQYVFAEMTKAGVHALAEWNGKSQAIHRIWPDFELKKLLVKSVSTVKADAAQTSYSAFGEDIVWAVLDSGVDRAHPHFAKYANLDVKPPLRHRDFSVATPERDPKTGHDVGALRDEFGHGTHVAGIIAGALEARPGAKGRAATPVRALVRRRGADGVEDVRKAERHARITGIAPRCKLVSMRILDEEGAGYTSSVIAALDAIMRINGHGRRLRIHGVNISAGYEFDPEWFACGQSPLCVEVDRLVRTGVVVVIAAGNSGYAKQKTEFDGTMAFGLALSINDPGNAQLAITVGATHRDSPHTYGVSYFSSKGPTGDGRLKPDLVAPGERILSCATGAGRDVEGAPPGQFDYVEESGTSMAAPHVSGAAAALLSIRREFIGKPDRIKDVLTSTATDLGRERYFQGHGMLDLMRAIQSI